MFEPKNLESRNNDGKFFGIGIENLVSKENIGTLWRSAYQMGASFIFTIGKTYKLQKSDTTNTYRQIPLIQYRDFDQFWDSMPYSCRLVGVEIDDKAENLVDFKHFDRNIYLLGSETNGLSERAVESCHDLVYIPSKGCLNVAATGSIIIYDRILKQNRIVSK